MSQSDAPKPPAVQEQVIFEGSASWIGRFKAFLITWIIALLLLIGSIAAKAYMEGTSVWVVVICVPLAIALVVGQLMYHASIRYRITNYRIDFERGLLGRRIDSMELWHADDIFFRQSIFKRLLGVGDIDVVAKDATTPMMEIKAIPNARATFDAIKSAVLNAKRQRGLLELG